MKLARTPSRLAVLVAVPLFLASGCTVGPDYEPPTPEVGVWIEPAPGDDAADDAADDVAAESDAELSRWWESFGDPTLDRLVETALEQNLDLRRAASRVAEARARLEVVAGRELPSVDAAASVAEQRLSEEGFLPVNRIPGFDRDQTIFDVGFDAAWEADLFGRVERTVESAAARYGESEELRRGAQVTVAAEVARVYLGLRGAQRRRAALRESIEAARRTLELVELQVEAGEVAAAERARPRADLAVLETRLPRLEAEIEAAALGLGVLVGELPETELDLVDGGALESDTLPTQLEPLAGLPVGERADLLRRRPDVRAAERRLAAATAEVGVAEAELFPRLTIRASGGFEAMALGDLGGDGSRTWQVLPFLSWRIFDRGRVRAEIRATEAHREAAALAYEKVVLQALSDAERALVRYRRGLDALALQDAAVAAATESRRFASLRFEAGDVPLFALLDAQRALARTREERAALHAEVATDLVAVFKALGGGWEMPDDPAGDLPGDPTTPRAQGTRRASGPP